jgi:hypothetical protein
MFSGVRRVEGVRWNHDAVLGLAVSGAAQVAAVGRLHIRPITV